MIRKPGAANRPVSDESVAPTLLPDAARERRQGGVMSDTDRLPDEVFTVTKKGRRRAMLGAVVSVVTILLWFVATDRDRFAQIGSGIIILMTVLGVVLIKKTGTPVIRLTVSGVEVPGVGHVAARILPWKLLSDVEYRLIRREGRFASFQQDSRLLVFRMGALPWAYVLPPGVADGERIAEAIRKRIRPEIAAKRDTLDAATFFEVVFDIRLPETARTVHAEYHPENGTGWWAVRMTPEALKTLKAGEGTVSEFYPLLPEQRFHVGDRKLAGVSELRGDYAISTFDWDTTPVLVVDREESVLHGLLTDAME